MGAAFVDVRVDDNTDEGRKSIGSTMAKWAGGLALGATISKGITDNLDIGQANAKLGAQLNLTKDVADKAGKIAGQVYRDNFGESIPEVTNAIGTIGQSLVNLNTVSDGQLKHITEGVLGLASTFDVDLNGVVDATSKLVTNKLAPDATAALDLVTRAFQTGGNKAGDLLETIGEYSPYFHNLGLDGSTALGLISQGLKAGARDSDYVADAFKELQIRAIDGSKATGTAFGDMGLDAQKMGENFAAGGDTAKQALLEVLTTLQNMKDPVAQNNAGVALFGTQWEDTMRQILPSMDLTEAGMTDVKGATDRLNDAAGDTAKGGLESVKRQMEGWVQSVTNMNGPLGDISSWILGFGGASVPFIAQLAQIGAGFATMGLFAEGSALRVVGSWIAMAASSVANAVVMAASWLLAFWPVALIIAAVAGLVALIILNWDTVKQITSDVWNAIWGYLKGIWDDIVKQVRNAVQWVVDAWNWFGELPGRIREWSKQLVLGAIQKFQDLVDWVRSLPGKILGAIGNVGDILYNIGKKIIEGLWNGLKNMWNKVTGWISTIGDWISDHKGPIEVDAVLLVPHGKAIMAGLADGLQADFNARVKPTVEGMAGDLANTTMPAPAVAPRPVDGPTANGTGAGVASTGHTTVIERLEVSFPGSLNAMNKTDLWVIAAILRDLLRRLDRGEVPA